MIGTHDWGLVGPDSDLSVKSSLRAKLAAPRVPSRSTCYELTGPGNIELKKRPKAHVTHRDMMLFYITINRVEGSWWLELRVFYH